MKLRRLEAIKENPATVADYKAGKEKALNSLVGAVMKKTKGGADARKVREVLMGKLGSDSTITDCNVSVQDIRLFNEKAEKLKRCSFTSTVFNQKTGVHISAKKGEPVRIERNGPNEEAIDAFVLTFRFFIQNNEKISFRNLAELYNKLPIHKIKKIILIL